MAPLQSTRRAGHPAGHISLLHLRQGHLIQIAASFSLILLRRSAESDSPRQARWPPGRRGGIWPFRPPRRKKTPPSRPSRSSPARIAQELLAPESSGPSSESNQSLANAWGATDKRPLAPESPEVSTVS